MNRTQIPAPPNPSNPTYNGSLSAWAADMYQWASQTKTRIEADSAVNVRPVSPFVVTTYTSVNTMTGTDALSNFVATLITAMQAKGLTSTRNLT